ncbi:MAG: hypothetical protein EP330_23955 [Deltaproteobacteria bacterium]|nr:MAG: hypothetical protein EP330_23955 [Deltaproteobacteria bacterium]
MSLTDLRQRVGRDSWRMAGLCRPLADGPTWWLWPVAAGVVPLGLGWALGTGLHQPLTALLLFLLMLPHVREERPVRGMGVLALGFAAHCAAAIALARVDPTGAAAAMPDGVGYWQAQVAWITTGTDPEYDWVNWVPAHLHLLVGIGVLAVLSMGFAPLMEGVYQVDLMNFYVGNLLAHSANPLPALLLGWHPWSVIRGLCYVVLVYELASLALQWLARRPLAARGTRRVRWAALVGLFLLDGAVKWVTLDLVRDGLAANLLDTPALHGDLR